MPKSVSDTVKEVVLSQLGVTSESLHKIKLGRGAVGKISVITAAALIAIGGVGLKLSDGGAFPILVVIGALVLIALAGLGCVLYVITKQPEIAVLEGAELVLYKQITLGVKGQPVLSPPTPVAEAPNLPEDDSSPSQGEES
jgi:hypothetical protein